MELSFLESDTFRWVVLPLLIFVARILDVSIGTMRIIFVARGNRIASPLLGFFEVLIWIFAIGQIMRNLSNVLCYFAYAAGFAAGTFIGLMIEEKLAVGVLLIRVITSRDATPLIESLRSSDYGVTNIPAEGSSGRVNVIYSVIPRSSLAEVLGIIERFNPRAFYSIENVRSVRKGIFPARGRPIEMVPLLRRLRIGK